MSFDIDAAVYDRFVGRYAPQLAIAFVEAAGVGRHDRVLDVGCGPGALTRALAERVGEANVAAVEPSPSFLAAVRARVPGADVRGASAESLPFEDDGFDAVLAQLVVNFMRDAEAGVAEMRRVARPGAVVAACVWDYAGGMTMFRSFWDAAVEADPEAPDESRMRYCTPDELAGLWRRAGLADVATDALVVAASYDDFDDLWAPFPSGIAVAGAYCRSLDPERRDALRQAYFRRLGRPEGAFTLTARAWFVRGRA